MADNIAPYIETGFGTDVNYLTFFDTWTLTFAFGLQIYFDFAGYSMIAIGSAYLFGFSLPKNFFFPYLSLNIRDFWKRWHITLSAWIRDYLYIPLTGQKFSSDKSTSGIEIHNGNENFALFATWSIMGLWHGASWGFLLWGVYQAILILVYRTSTKLFNFKLPKVISWLITIIFVMAGWIFFRADNLSNALDMYIIMFNIFDIDFKLGLKENFYLITFLYVIVMIIAYQIFRFKDYIINNSFLYYLFMYIFFTVSSFIIFVEMKQVEQFIYFQF
jgi:alginate O-acetyltransferase complex protein AlgI